METIDEYDNEARVQSNNFPADLQTYHSLIQVQMNEIEIIQSKIDQIIEKKSEVVFDLPSFLFGIIFACILSQFTYAPFKAIGLVY